MIEKLVVPHTILPAHLKCQIMSFIRIEWADAFTGPNRLRDWIADPGDHAVSLMLVENGILQSHAEVVWKCLDHVGERYKVYGLTGVFTYPAFRRQGYGRQVVEMATSYIKGSDADLGMFHCAPHLRGFYEKCGWLAMDHAVTLFGPRDHPSVSKELMMTLFLTEKGKSGRTSIENIPLYFGSKTW